MMTVVAPLAPVVGPVRQRRRPAQALFAAAFLAAVGLLAIRSAGHDGFVGARMPTNAVAARSHAGLRGVGVAMQASEKVDKIVEEMKTLTLLEASELVKEIEEVFGVDASASGGAVMMAAPAAGGDAPAAEAEEQTEFDVILKEVPKAKKIAILKVIRTLLGLGLKDAKAMVDNPGKIMEGKPKEVCDDAKTQIEEAGGVVEIK